jgi:CheY-specific phosphatase CheX
MNYFGQEIVSVIFLDISERLAFMFGDPVARDEIETEGGSWAQAGVDFTGGTCGRLTLSAPRDLCLEIAANILGTDPEELADGPLAEDALRELLNVVTGHVVPGLQGEDASFELAVPTYRGLEPAAVAALLQDPATICYRLDDSPVLLNLVIGES